MDTIEVTLSPPDISSYYTEMIPNYLFNTEELLLTTRITDMDADSIAFLYINDKIFKMETDDDLNYTATILSGDIGIFMLKKWKIVAVGPGGVTIYPADSSDYEWMGVVEYDRKVTLLEGWSDDDSILNWDIVGEDISAHWSYSKMLYIYCPCNVLEEQYISKDIHKMNANIPWEFNMNLGMSSSMTDDAGILIGVFGDSDDVTVIKNFIGLRKYVEAGIHQMSVVVIDQDGNKTEQAFLETLEDFGDGVLYTVKYVWIPKDKTIVAELYKTSETNELTLVETITKVLSSLPNVELDKYGVHYDYAATVIWERLYFGSTMLRIGEVDQTIHKVVDELEINADEMTDTDYHIVLHYYDFTTGETLTADADLDVEIHDSDGVTIATLSAVQREDGKYEAFWNTIGIPTDTYLVKITGSLNGRIKVSKKLVSVENE